MAQLAYETYFEEQKIEMHNGKTVAMGRGTPNHARVCMNIIFAFEQFLVEKSCTVWSEVDIHLSNDDCFTPDVAIVCNQDIIKNDGIHGTPDLVVEVLSPSTNRYDRGYKKESYEKSGIKEYWIVTIEARSVEVYLLKDNRFELDNVYTTLPVRLMHDSNSESIEFSPSMFPDLNISLNDVFKKLI
jgi:Uma2 family endonuclease